MTKAVRNSASETITALGGAVAVPSAVRRSDSTTTMRVNEVIMTRIDGASDSTVSSAIIWITRSVSPLPCAKLMLMSCATAGVTAAAITPATPIATVTRRTRRSESPVKFFLTDGRASWPSPVRDCRTMPGPPRARVSARAWVSILASTFGSIFGRSSVRFWLLLRRWFDLTLDLRFAALARIWTRILVRCAA